jgi:hypothetical protein
MLLQCVRIVSAAKARRVREELLAGAQRCGAGVGVPRPESRARSGRVSCNVIIVRGGIG